MASPRWAAVALAAAAPVLAGSIGTTTNFDERVVAAHNRERSKMGAPPLAWDNELAKGAQAWASHLSATGRFEHSPDGPGSKPVGENIWAGTAARFQPESMVGLWVEEKKFYRPGVFPSNSVTGNMHDVTHYTQVIWSSSRKVGCGLSRSTREDILVCRYSEAGNVMGQSPL